MADITVRNENYRWTFSLQRNDDTTTRTLSIDNIQANDTGLSAAKEFRDVFTGAASSPFSIIDPKTFIQPTGWRDNDPNEAPWTTVDCNLAKVTEETIYYDKPQPPAGVRNIAVTGNLDGSSTQVFITYDGITQDGEPTVSMLEKSGNWNPQTLTWRQAQNCWSFYKIDNFDSKANVYVPGWDELPPDSLTFDVLSL